MRYVFIGAGAIGAGIGGLLAHTAQDVVLVARGDHLAAMREHGLRLLYPDGDVTVRPKVAATPSDLTLYDDDVLVLTTKTHQAHAALSLWTDAPVRSRESGDVVGTAGQVLPLLTALNGVASEDIALRWFARVYAVCVWMPAVLVAPGQVVVRCAPIRAILHTSRFPAALADDGDEHFLSLLAQDWAKADIEVPLPADAMPWKYRKLLGNLGNAVQALATGPGAGDISGAARTEAEQLYAAVGVVMNSEAEEQQSRDRLQVAPVPGAPAELGGSTWQSLHRGTGSAESDYLNGEIVAMAHRAGQRAPINETLARLMREAVCQGRGPGAMTTEDLRQLVADNN